jgi:hypothetical protein
MEHRLASWRQHLSRRQGFGSSCVYAQFNQPTRVLRGGCLAPPEDGLRNTALGCGSLGKVANWLCCCHKFLNKWILLKRASLPPASNCVANSPSRDTVGKVVCVRAMQSICPNCQYWQPGLRFTPLFGHGHFFSDDNHDDARPLLEDLRATVGALLGWRLFRLGQVGVDLLLDLQLVVARCVCR